jgi:methionyl aminopeptidase
MREAGRHLAGVLDVLEKSVREGISTNELDRMARTLIEKTGCKPAFLGYAPAGAHKPYPATICASLNDGVVHGLPSDKTLVSGDLLKIDIGLVHKGWYADMARTYAIGTVAPRVRELIDTTRGALDAGIAAAVAGNTLGDIGYAVQSVIEANKFTVVKGLTGHGVGRKLHEDPYVYNEGKPGIGDMLEVGMVIAIEPMVTMGKGRTRQGPDDSFVIADGSLAAHFEHTMAITANGPEILTVA